MAKLLGFDLPPEFDLLFNSIFGLPTYNVLLYAIQKPPKQAYKKALATSNRSDFVIFAPTYNGLSSGRKIAWMDYWESLPFGSHSGANGWPGSGFSAFVYVNAPRYKVGMSLLLDPPSVDLVSNGGFDGNADGWYFGDAAFYNDNDVGIFDSGGGSNTLGFGQNISEIEDGVVYNVQFDIVAVDDPGDEARTIGILIGQDTEHTEFCTVGHHSFNHTAVVFDVGAGALEFYRKTILSNVYIDNVQLFRV